MIPAREEREVIRGFKPCRVVGQSRVGRARNGGHVQQSGIFLA